MLCIGELLSMNFSGMSIGELTQTYNEMVMTAIDLNLPQFKEVKKFRDKPTGVKRCELLHSEIQEKRKPGGGGGPGLERLRKNAKSDDLAKQVVAEQEAARKAVRAPSSARKETKKATSSARSKVPDDGKIHILVDKNPKRGTAGQRFAMYKTGMAVSAYREKVGKKAARDLSWDIKKGYIKIV